MVPTKFSNRIILQRVMLCRIYEYLLFRSFLWKETVVGANEKLQNVSFFIVGYYGYLQLVINNKKIVFASYKGKNQSARFVLIK